MPRHQATPIRRATRCLWAEAACHLGTVESKRVDEFANMSDDELRAYVYGKQDTG